MVSQIVHLNLHAHVPVDRNAYMLAVNRLALHALGRHEEALKDMQSLMERWGQSDSTIRHACVKDPFERLVWTILAHFKVREEGFAFAVF
jgi:hypothetical protein